MAYKGVSENSVPLFTQWFCWSLSHIIPIFYGYFIGNLPNIFRQTHNMSIETPWLGTAASVKQPGAARRPAPECCSSPPRGGLIPEIRRGHHDGSPEENNLGIPATGSGARACPEIREDLVDPNVFFKDVVKNG